MATAVVLVAFVVSWLIPERPLRKTVETTVGDVIGGPVDTDSMREVARALSIAVGRERTLAFLADTVAPRGRRSLPGRVVGAAAAGGARRALGREPGRAPARPARSALLAAVEELRGLGLLEGERPTEAGHGTRERLVAARTDGLRTLIADWEPDQNPELDPLLRRLADELAAPA